MVGCLGKMIGCTWLSERCIARANLPFPRMMWLSSKKGTWCFIFPFVTGNPMFKNCISSANASFCAVMIRRLSASGFVSILRVSLVSLTKWSHEVSVSFSEGGGFVSNVKAVFGMDGRCSNGSKN